ncbi:sodium:solute symporter family protein [Brevibacterium sp. 50QC2O2]|uniref:sodium:solute symporter family protein n=1 Tax=Brevibacterium sp. 50QC2O2 TaxID=2968459 RepID=UPI00211BA9B0|nr:sodium:solute symporter family protein [Brevibacterium sp. 50QC2O2]MCQ9389465.1 sodium:solute symporter family protein [Brevibacterium sp. 50QC2O2]
MSSSAIIAIIIFALAMVATVAIGVYSGRGREKSMDEWSVSSRGLGFIFVLLLMAGESYTSFSFLGAAGWSYKYGVPILYLIGYLSVGLIIAYVLAPTLWTYAARHKLVGLTDIIEYRFKSRPLAIFVAIAATIFMLPYIQLQIQGMGTVVNAMSYGAIDLKVAAIISFIVAELFILVSGLRGSAWVSVLKDGLTVAAIAFLAIYVPLHYFDGVGELVGRMIQEKPQWLTFPGAGGGEYGAAWFISTILLNTFTTAIFPTTLAGYISADSANSLRRNSIILPWYQVLLLVPVMIGMAALFVVPALANGDLALFSVVIDSLPAPLVAIIGVAGALSAIVPMSVFMLAIGTMWGRTVLGGGLTRAHAPADSAAAAQDPAGARQRKLSQVVCLIAGLVALAGSLFMPNALVSLSVLSYEGMAQLVPAALLGLFWPRMSKHAAAAGIVVGGIAMLTLYFTGNDPLWGVNGGVWALALNFLVVVVLSLVSPDPRWRKTWRSEARATARAAASARPAQVVESSRTDAQG